MATTAAGDDLDEVKSALQASAGVQNEERLSSSHSRVAKKLSAMALSQHSPSVCSLTILRVSFDHGRTLGWSPLAQHEIRANEYFEHAKATPKFE
jgi:hypothetical protein